MTTGSFDNLVRTFVSTDCGSSDSYFNGRTVTWTGADDPLRVRRKKNFWTTRKVLVGVRTVYRYTRVNGVKAKRPVGDKPIYQKVRVLVRAGERIPRPLPTPHNFSKSWLIRRGQFVTRYSSVFPPQTCCYPIWVPLEIPDGWSSAEEYKLLSRLQTKMTGSDFNLASFLGAEGRDTVHGILTVATRVARSLYAMKRGDFPTAMKVLFAGSRPPSASWNPKSRVNPNKLRDQREIYDQIVRSQRKKPPGSPRSWLDLTADHWLEYHLAVEPLLGDVKAGAEKLAHLTNLPRRQRYYSSVKKKYQGTKASPANPGACEWKTMERVHYVKLIHYVSYFPSNLALTGLLDPEVVLWNAIPLSFVADWFLPIGDFLEARSFAQKLSGQFVRCEKIDRVFDEPLIKYDGGGRLEFLVANTATRYQDGSFTRTVSSSIGVPLPTLKPLGVFSSWQRMATAVALITGFSRKES